MCRVPSLRRRRRSGWDVCTRFHRKVSSLSLISDRWESKGCGSDASDSSAPLSSCFFQQSTHGSGAPMGACLSGRVLQSESDKHLVSQTDVSSLHLKLNHHKHHENPGGEEPGDSGLTGATGGPSSAPCSHRAGTWNPSDRDGFKFRPTRNGRSSLWFSVV